MLPSIVFLDIETGGLDIGDPITQIAALAVAADTFEELSFLDLRLRFNEAACQAKALEVSHYDAARWASEAIEPSEACTQLAGFLNRYSCISRKSQRTGRPYSVAQPAGHNIGSFDLPRLSHFFSLFDRFFPISYNHALDTLHGCRWYFQQRGMPFPDSLKLFDLVKHFGLTPAEGLAHDALTDVRLASQLAKILLQRGAPLGEPTASAS